MKTIDMGSEDLTPTPLSIHKKFAILEIFIIFLYWFGSKVPMLSPLHCISLHFICAGKWLSIRVAQIRKWQNSKSKKSQYTIRNIIWVVFFLQKWNFSYENSIYLRFAPVNANRFFGQKLAWNCFLTTNFRNQAEFCNFWILRYSTVNCLSCSFMRIAFNGDSELNILYYMQFSLHVTLFSFFNKNVLYAICRTHFCWRFSPYSSTSFSAVSFSRLANSMYLGSKVKWMVCIWYLLFDYLICVHVILFFPNKSTINVIAIIFHGITEKYSSWVLCW